MKHDRDFAILRLLGDGREHSGELIAQHLDCSRALVWKHICHIQTHYNLAIQRVKGHGYRLLTPVEWLNSGAIQGALSEQASRFYNLEVVDQVDSTNTQLMQNASRKMEDCSVLAAEWQHVARGRQGRPWKMVLGEQLAFSVCWPFHGGLTALSGLSLAVGIAVARVLHHYHLPVTLKWPNDIQLDGRKLAGILIELTGGDALDVIRVVIGIGINLSAPKGIDQPVAGLAEAIPTPSRNQLLADILNELYIVLIDFLQHGFPHLKQEWMQYCAHMGSSVRLLLPQGKNIEGVVEGIDKTGALLVRTEHGEQTFHIGEVSLRDN